MRINEDLFFLINNLAGKNSNLDKILALYGQYFPYLLGLIFILIVYIHSKRDNLTTLTTIIKLGFAIGIGYSAKLALSLFLFYDRPFIKNTVNLLLPKENDSSSFPSGHTLTAFSIIGIAYFYNKKLALVLGICAFVGGILRIYGGVHYPFDILGGILFGLVASWISETLVEFAKKRFYITNIEKIDANK